MSKCIKWTTRLVITCKNWGERLVHVCTEWADEGYSECARKEDQGYNTCSKWGKKCGWEFWNCIIQWFCVAWTWVSNLVCVAWHWVVNMVCKAFAWILKLVCIAFGWLLTLVCSVWDTVKCIPSRLKNVYSRLFGLKKNSSGIEHVFVLMLENRSFDHLLGFSGIEGKDAITNNPTSVNGANPARDQNIDPVGGANIPVSIPAELSLKGVDKDPGHEFLNVLAQLCGKGAVYPSGGPYPAIDNSGFVANYRDDGSVNPGRIMKCYSPRQLPVLNALAKEFVVCDNWFSSLPGPTFPNRMFMHAATSGGLDDSPSDVDIVVGTGFEGFRFENGNIFDALDDRCIRWKIVEGDEFPVSFCLRGMNLNATQGKFLDFDEFKEFTDKLILEEKFIFIEPKYGKHEFDFSGPGDFTCGNSMHPLDDVTRGEKLVKEVYEIIRNSPHWEKSVLLITFDEHGGFYDHVAPPKAVAPGDLETLSYKKHNFKFDQLGVRVPAIIVSPRIKKNLIDHTVYDHTSLIATVERMFNVKSLTERDKNANDFLHLFQSSARTDTPTKLPSPANPELACKEIDSAEHLFGLRAELIEAKETGRFRGEQVRDERVAHMQRVFAYAALLKVLPKSEYPERVKWTEHFKECKTTLDLGIFMAEAKLKTTYSIDIKKVLRLSSKEQKLKAIRKGR